MALGGLPNKDGFIDAKRLIDIIKNQFEMTIDIEKLIDDIDEDKSGQIEYDEFMSLLSSSDWTLQESFNSKTKAVEKEYWLLKGVIDGRLLLDKTVDCNLKYALIRTFIAFIKQISYQRASKNCNVFKIVYFPL